MAAPTKVTGSYSAVGIAPHALTSRWSYTVPAGRFAIAEVMRAWAMREVAAAPVARAGAVIFYTPSGGAAIIVCNAQHQLNTVGADAKEIWGGEMRLVAGDNLSGFTLDGSTGGTFTLQAAFVGTEYDV